MMRTEGVLLCDKGSKQRAGEMALGAAHLTNAISSPLLFGQKLPEASSDRRIAN